MSTRGLRVGRGRGQAIFTAQVAAQIDVNQAKRARIMSQIAFNQTQVNAIIDGILQTALFDVLADGVKWIRKFVPKATSQLQDNLIETLNNQSGMLGSALRLIVGTGAGGGSNKYVRFVARMNKATVRHPKGKHKALRRTKVFKTVRGIKKFVGFRTRLVTINPDRRWVNYYGFRGYINLNDPQAQGKFWGLLLLYLRQRLQIHLSSAIRQFARRNRIRARPFSQQMKVTVP